jgi:hypothetical protein
LNNDASTNIAQRVRATLRLKARHPRVQSFRGPALVAAQDMTFLVSTISILMKRAWSVPNAGSAGRRQPPSSQFAPLSKQSHFACGLIVALERAVNRITLASLVLVMLSVGPSRAGAAPVNEPTTTRQDGSKPDSPRSAVWIQAGLPVSLIWAGATGNSTLYLPIGANFNVWGHPIALEVTPIYDRLRSTEITWRSVGLITAVGPMLFTGPEPLRGFFLEPKLLVSMYRISLLLGPPPHDFPGPYDNRHFLTASVSIGLDIGYQLVWGHLYLAVVGGLAVGYCHNCSRDGFASGLLTEYNDVRTNRLAFDFNLNLLRIGIAW